MREGALVRNTEAILDGRIIRSSYQIVFGDMEECTFVMVSNFG